MYAMTMIPANLSTPRVDPFQVLKYLILIATSVLIYLVFIPASWAASPGIKGAIGGVHKTAEGYVIRGWACDSGINKFIAIHLYAGGPAGTGKIIKGATANWKSTPAVSTACKTRKTSHWFSVELTTKNINKFANQPIYIHGISRTRGANKLIGRSGKFNMPGKNDIGAESGSFIDNNSSGINDWFEFL